MEHRDYHMAHKDNIQPRDRTVPQQVRKHRLVGYTAHSTVRNSTELVRKGILVRVHKTGLENRVDSKAGKGHKEGSNSS